MSAFPPIATELRTSLEVRFVPRTDVGSGERCNAAFSGIADADEMARGKRLSLMTCGTRYDDNFLSEKDDISARLGNGGRTCAGSFGGLKNLFGSLPAVERNSRNSVERFVFVQREIDFICNDTGPLHHPRNVNLNPPCLELLERHSIGTLQDTDNLISHSSRSAALDPQTG